MSDPQLLWRGPFTSAEANQLHAAAFGTRVYTDDEWDWVALVERHSLGWCTARIEGELVGFTNVIWDGLVHAWLQDVTVSPSQQRSGIGQSMVELAVEEAKQAGCEWLHVDFDDDEAGFYVKRCGFKPANAGLKYLG
ncbi:MAG: GNAT family N-acetyltransferase [Acidimicrobiia bacterium]